MDFEFNMAVVIQIFLTVLTPESSVTNVAKILSKKNSSKKGNCNLKSKEKGGGGEGGVVQTLLSNLANTLMYRERICNFKCQIPYYKSSFLELGCFISILFIAIQQYF